MYDNISEQTKLKLWTHQSDALNFAIEHLNHFDTPCLIRMPTGTGKTGIIACLTMLSNQGSSLVLTPWAYLRDQMIADLENNFWKKVNLNPKKYDVISILPSTAMEIFKTKKNQVIVSTFTTLNDLRRDLPNTYKELSHVVSLVIVDEGHYEPAVEWGKSVKGLDTKTVLLTATPYRNDLKLFRITDPNRSSYHYTHKKAINEKIIRDLRFENLASPINIHSLTVEFTKKWIDAKKNKSFPSKTPRAIICCSNAIDIEEVVGQLWKEGIKAIGIHEQFAKSTSPNLLKDVPNPKDTDIEVWVHQNKLTEGIDDNRFSCIALFTHFRNDRKMIQQVGRILRLTSTDIEKPAIIYAPSVFSVESEWKSYREFETQLKLLEPEHYREIVENLLISQPEVEYFQGRFRRRFNSSDLSRNPQVIIPPSVLVRLAENSFSLDDYIEDCTDTLNMEDAIILGPDINAPCQKTNIYALWVYASFRNSRYLQNTSLYEIKLEIHCVVFCDGIVLIADSRGNYPKEYIEDHTTGIPQEKLTRYLDDSFRLTNVSIDSSIPYDTVIRGAEIRGHNLLSIPASLTDRVQICSSARGSSKDDGRRYVGMNNGRLRKELTEDDRITYDLDKFISWAKNAAKILNSDKMCSALFLRYMPTCEPPLKPIPKTICIDLLSVDLSLSLIDGRECRLRSSSANIENLLVNDHGIYRFTFDLDGNGLDSITTSLFIEYQPSKKRFWFRKDKGVTVRVNINGENETSSKSLVEFLNQKQEILLIGLEGGNIVYQGRKFYKIDYSYAEQTLLNLISRPSNAPICRTEKGSPDEIKALRLSRDNNFPNGSIFKAVADRLITLPLSDSILICSDLGTECADFIAANLDKHQLALVHAKIGKGTKISASAFHDVVSQAMKNLVYLTRNGGSPDGVKSWWSGGKWNKTNVPRLYRKIEGIPSRGQLWKKIKSEIIDTSHPDLYIILATSGCCDLHELEKAVRDPSKRTHETAQLLHLLDGLNGYARQLGINLLIYDLPYQPA